MHYHNSRRKAIKIYGGKFLLIITSVQKRSLSEKWQITFFHFYIAILVEKIISVVNKITVKPYSIVRLLLLVSNFSKIVSLAILFN